MNIHELLYRIIQSKQLHGRFLYHLSVMEKSGHQKLLRFKHRWNIKAEDFLRHLTDEAKHAAHLKELAQKLTPDEEKPSSTTKNYLTRLEIFLLRHLREQKIDKPFACYAVLTYIIEKRALTFYPVYEKVLQLNGLDMSLEPIISDEAHHLDLMEEELARMDIPQSLMASGFIYEEELFKNYLSQFLSDRLLSNIPDSSSNCSDFTML